VSCASAGNCTAVGDYGDSSGHGQGLLLTESIEPKLSALRVSPRRFVLAGRTVGRRCVNPTRENNRDRPCQRPIKLTISYTLSATATVIFTLKQQVPGRDVNRRCVEPTRQNEEQRNCTRLVSVHGKIVRSGNTGANDFTFTGMIVGHKLGPGSYQLTATPNTAGSAGAPESLRFTLVGRHPRVPSIKSRRAQAQLPHPVP
jgi:hypothetical protein